MEKNELGGFVKQFSGQGLLGRVRTGQKKGRYPPTHQAELWCGQSV